MEQQYSSDDSSMPIMSFMSDYMIVKTSPRAKLTPTCHPFIYKVCAVGERITFDDTGAPVEACRFGMLIEIMIRPDSQSIFSSSEPDLLFI